VSARVLAGAGVLAAAALFVVFVLLVRAEPRPGLAAGGLVLAAVAAVVVRGPRWAPLLAIPVAVAVLDRMRVYVPFSLERPEEIGSLVFSLLVLAVVGVCLVTGPVAVLSTYRAVRRATTWSAAGGLAVAALLGVALAASAQPDQGEGLTAAERASLPQVVMDDYRYVPDALSVQAGQELQVLLVNDDTETYRLVLDELDVDVVVPSGREAVVRLRPEARGTFTWYSSEEDGEHRALGMVGTLEVR
jgi:plastocyanin